jgi:hypothetical protein
MSLFRRRVSKQAQGEDAPGVNVKESRPDAPPQTLAGWIAEGTLFTLPAFPESSDDLVATAREYARVHEELEQAVRAQLPPSALFAAMHVFEALGVSSPNIYDSTHDLFRPLISLSSLVSTGLRAWIVSLASDRTQATALLIDIQQPVMAKVLLACRDEQDRYIGYYFDPLVLQGWSPPKGIPQPEESPAAITGRTNTPFVTVREVSGAEEATRSLFEEALPAAGIANLDLVEERFHHTTDRVAKSSEHYLLTCTACGFTHDIPRDCALPTGEFSVDVDEIKMTCVYGGGAFTVTLQLNEFFSITVAPESGEALRASIVDNMKPIHAHLLSHYDPLYLVIAQSRSRTTHRYTKLPEEKPYVKFSRERGRDIVGNIDVSKAEIPGVSWTETASQDSHADAAEGYTVDPAEESYTVPPSIPPPSESSSTDPWQPPPPFHRFLKHPMALGVTLAAILVLVLAGVLGYLAQQGTNSQASRATDVAPSTPVAPSGGGSAVMPTPVVTGLEEWEGDGIYPVGTSINPGAYQTAGPVSRSKSCYWARLRTSMPPTGPQEIIGSDSTSGPTTVTIEAGDAGFETEGCQPWYRVS